MPCTECKKTSGSIDEEEKDLCKSCMLKVEAIRKIGNNLSILDRRRNSLTEFGLEKQYEEFKGGRTPYYDNQARNGSEFSFSEKNTHALLYLNNVESSVVDAASVSAQNPIRNSKATGPLASSSASASSSVARSRSSYDSQKPPSNRIPKFEDKFLKNGRMLFVLSPDYALYGVFYGTGKSLTRENIHHTSFLAGGPIRCAGHIHVDQNGYVILIANDSGHYKPAAISLFYVLFMLVDLDVDLSKLNLNVCSSSEPSGTIMTCRKFLINYGKEAEAEVNNSIFQAVNKKIRSDFAQNQASKPSIAAEKLTLNSACSGPKVDKVLANSLSKPIGVGAKSFRARADKPH